MVLNLSLTTLDLVHSLTVGTAVKGQLSSSSDVDYFKFTSDGSGTATVSFDSPLNSSLDYFRFTVFDANGTNLGAYSTGRDLSADLGISSAGTYYVSLDSPGYYHTDDQYSLTVSLASGSSAGYESESNSSTSSADSLTLGTAIKGQLSSSSDVDYYKFTADGSGTVTISLDSPLSSSLSYFRFTLYDDSGNDLGSYSTGKDLSVDLGISSAGTYYIKLDSPSYYHTDKQYSLTASFATGSSDGFESESNDTRSSADSLTVGTAVKGQLSSSSDVDYFKFTSDGSGTATVSFDSPLNSSLDYFRFTVFDANGTNLGAYSTGRDLSADLGISSAGTYYVSWTLLLPYGRSV